MAARGTYGEARSRYQRYRNLFRSGRMVPGSRHPLSAHSQHWTYTLVVHWRALGSEVPGFFCRRQQPAFHCPLVLYWVLLGSLGTYIALLPPSTRPPRCLPFPFPFTFLHSSRSFCAHRQTVPSTGAVSCLQSRLTCFSPVTRDSNGTRLACGLLHVRARRGFDDDDGDDGDDEDDAIATTITAIFLVLSTKSPDSHPDPSRNLEPYFSFSYVSPLAHERKERQ